MYSPKKEKRIRGIHQANLNKKLRKPIMLTPSFKNKAKKSKSNFNIVAFKM